METVISMPVGKSQNHHQVEMFTKIHKGLKQNGLHLGDLIATRMASGLFKSATTLRNLTLTS